MVQAQLVALAAVVRAERQRAHLVGAIDQGSPAARGVANVALHGGVAGKGQPVSHWRRIPQHSLVCLHDAVMVGIEEDLPRSEEHTSELQSLMRISYAVFCLKKKTQLNPKQIVYNTQR